MILAVALVYGFRDTFWTSLPLPQRRKLIPQSVFEAGMLPGLFHFGVEYGSGVRTLVTAGAPIVVLGGLLLGALPGPWIVLGGVAFGAARGLAPLLHLMARDPEWQQRQDREGPGTSAVAGWLAMLLVTAGLFA